MATKPIVIRTSTTIKMISISLYLFVSDVLSGDLFEVQMMLHDTLSEISVVTAG